MEHEELTRKIDAYLEENWETMVEDIETLVRIPSFEESDKATEGAPFGPGPKEALEAALEMASDMGFKTHDAEGYIGFADFPGKSDTQLGIIGHMDVVPAGPGWNFEPYAVTRKEGYLVGRGTLDDKGPSVVALHAMKFWKDLQDAGEAPQFPYTVRFLFGANEESGMADVAYYHKHYDDPAFLFTPDAEFPVCYGEKGIYHSLMTSADVPVEQRTMISFEGGTAVNAVPGHAQAVVRAGACDLPAAQGIEVELLDERDAATALEAAGAQADAVGYRLARITATGRSAHASLPQGGVSAIGLLIGYLLENGLVSEGERACFEAVARIAAATDGSTVGLACSDADFGELTIVAGHAAMQGGRFTQTIDVRYPTTITGDEVHAKLEALAQAAGGTCEKTRDDAPFLLDPQGPAIQALLASYNQATGEDARPFTMGGGTYAREFSCAASFGPEKPWEQTPEWVGGMHGPDEGVGEQLLKEAFRIYALTIGKLMQLDL